MSAAEVRATPTLFYVVSNFRVVLVKNCDRFGRVCDRTFMQQLH
ncbi:hypothetical protein [Nostoc sp.]